MGHALTSTSAADLKTTVYEFLQDVGRITRLRVWLTVNGAYIFYVAVMGVYAYWGPQVGDGAESQDRMFLVHAWCNIQLWLIIDLGRLC